MPVFDIAELWENMWYDMYGDRLLVHVWGLLDKFANIWQILSSDEFEGVQQFYSDKFDITKPPRYNYLAYTGKKNIFDH